MGFAEAAIAFIVVGMPVILVYAIVTGMLRHREKKMELEARIAEAQAAGRSAESRKLEARVRVLERIVTDKGLDVADEIERLRLTSE